MATVGLVPMRIARVEEYKRTENPCEWRSRRCDVWFAVNVGPLLVQTRGAGKDRVCTKARMTMSIFFEIFRDRDG